MGQATEGFVGKLADYASGLSYEALSPQTVLCVKKCILDATANMVSGRYTAMGNKVLHHIQKEQDLLQARDSHVAGEVCAYQLEQAIFANAVMARSCDLDDGFRDAMGHPGAVLVPAALCYSEYRKCSGKQMLTALAAGYEIYARLGRALNPSMYRERGFESTSVCGSIAAAAMIGLLEKAGANTIANAMGIASLFTGGLIEYQNDGTDGKVLSCGWAALDGLKAYRLAAAGFSGPVAALEGNKGFLQAHRGSVMDLDAVLKDLGKGFAVNSVYFKRHACMRGLHAAVDAAVELRGKYHIQVSEIQSVSVCATPFLGRLSNPDPQTLIAAQCSLQFSIACALTCGHLYEEDLTALFSDWNTRELAKKVQILNDPEVEQYLQQHPTHWTAARLELTCTGGRKYEQWSPVPIGDVETPLSFEELGEKFMRMAGSTPYSARVSGIVEKIHTLDQQQEVHLL